jgi:hypothetical protein
MYIPGCPPTPPATIHGFAVALGLLKQKMQAGRHVQEDGEHSQLILPHIPLELRIEIERAARRMAGYWHGKRIAHTFLGLIRDGDKAQLAADLKTYLQKQADPRLAEIMGELEQIYRAS